jgi:C4-dicarboxylate transporter/malic acid transport protein
MLTSAPTLPRAGTTPNWFASVMGTGIVANAVPLLPVRIPGLHEIATMVWALAAAWLVWLCMVMGREWRRNRAGQLAHLRDPVLAHFWGAPPIALLTVGAGALSLGRDWIGLDPALGIDWTLWTVGTVFGLVTAVGVPYRMIMGQVEHGEVFAGWLMPVVPPMVSAATGAALIPYLPAGQPRLAMLLGCYGLFGVSLFATLALLPLIWHRLVRLGPGAVPTVWIVLGPLGQSVTAANLLGAVAPGVLPDGAAAQAFGLIYGVPTWGFAMLWLALAVAVTVRSAVPFSLTWWSFTFPLGTCVTGTSALATATHSALFTAVAVALYVLLAGLWLTVAGRTALTMSRGARLPRRA